MSLWKRHAFRSVVAFALILANCSIPDAKAQVRYVDASIPVAGNGTTWALAYKSLASALTTEVGAREFWVAQGTYNPLSATTPMITLESDVVYGGFATPVAGVGATVNTDRDWQNNPTIYTGDWSPVDNVSDIVINDNATTERSFFLANSAGVVLDGFTFQYGRSLSTNTRHGGVLYVAGSGTTTIRHCKFLNNLGQRGGAIGGEGGAFTITVEDSLFWGNKTQSNLEYPQTPATFGAGAVAGQTTFTGPGIANRGSGSLLNLRNCTFGGNSRPDATTGYDVDIASAAGASTFKNSIFWSSEAPISFGTVPTITYSNVRQASGTYSGTGNINADPLFVNLATGDLQLRSYPTFSPCMDAAPDPTAGTALDLVGLTRPIDGKADGGANEYDMGAYETQFKWGAVASVGAPGGGTVSPTADESLPGGNLTFTATPYTDFEVDRWEDPLGNVVQSGNSTTYTITSIAAHHPTLTVFFKTTAPGYLVTVDTDPAAANLAFTVDATPYNGTTVPFVWDGGTDHDLEVTPAVQMYAGNRYTFSTWVRSEGGASLDNPYNYVTAGGPGPYTVTAQFDEEYTLTMTMGTGGSAITPGAGATYHSPGATVPITATPISVTYAFANWSGPSVADVADPNSASTTINMSAPGNKSITANFRRIVYVDLSMAAEGNGQSWATAYKTLWNALKTETTAGQEYWVAEGTHNPDSTTTPMVTLQSDIVYGGFATPIGGVGASSRDDRNWEANPTIVTGDWSPVDGVSDIVISDNATTERSFFLANSAGIVLDGFTFQYGRSLSTNTRHGGAIYIDSGSTTIRNCKFLNNHGQRGGAIGSDSNPFTLTVENSLFAGNHAQTIAEYPLFGATANTIDGWGPGIANRSGNAAAVVTLRNCTFADNQKQGFTSGLDLDGATSAGAFDIKNCIFWSSEDSISTVTPSIITYSNVRQASGTYTGTGNINSDPNFDVGYGLLGPSDCIDAGDDTGVATYDLAHAARIQGAAVDMGAYEKAAGGAQGDITVNDSPNGGAFDVEITGPSVGTQNGTTDFTLTSLDQGTIALEATSPKAINGTSRYLFEKWNDGTSDFTSNPLTGYNFNGNKTFTLSFVTQYLCSATTIPASGAGTATLSPVDGWVTDGEDIEFTANPSAPFAFSHWTIGGITQPDGAVMTRTVSGAPVVAVAHFACGDNSVTVQTDPAGLEYTADGDTQTSPKTYCWAVGNKTVSTPAIHVIVAGESEHRFALWSDGVGSYGTASINYPVVATRTLEATFDTYHKLDVTAPVNGTLGYAPALPGDNYYVDGQTVTVTATPSPLYALSGWTGTATVGATYNGNDITFTMDGYKTLTATFAQPLRVDADSVSGSPDGTTWATAYPTLQAALAVATSGQEIWVADGTYKPGTLTSDRFNLSAGVAIYGGFNATETFRSQRNWKNNVTILTGDLSGNDTANWGNRSDNAVNVVYASGIANARLDGFTVRGGYGPVASSSMGGGLSIRNSQVTVANCTVTDNCSDLYGGGIYFWADANQSASLVENCLIVTNLARTPVTGHGGGIAIIPAVNSNDKCPVTILNCTIVQNCAGSARAGGVYCQYETIPDHVVIRNSIVKENRNSAGLSDVQTQAGLITVYYSDVTSNGGTVTDGGNNLNWPSGVDPLFADSANGNWRLQSGSPCLSTAQASAAPAADLDGRARPQGIGVDMGAYEYAPPLTVTINVAGGQGDPTSSTPINFTVVFSEAVTDFVTGDVTLSGTAGATTAVVTGSGTTYNVAVSGMTVTGTVIASIDAGKANSAAIVENSASTSTDNSVDYTYAIPLPDQTVIQFQ